VFACEISRLPGRWRSLRISAVIASSSIVERFSMDLSGRDKKAPQRRKKKTVGSDNFLVRSRKIFSEHGVLTITPDAPSDNKYLKNSRQSLDYRTDISFLIKEIRKETSKPIWLIGTSRGANTVGYHAAGLKIQGVVFTATVTEGKNDTIFDTDFSKIMVPALVVHNKSDLCFVSPVWGAEVLFKQLTQSSKKHILLFKSDDPGFGRECGATTPHGFLGIEKKVIFAMTEWMFNAVGNKK